MLLVLPLLDHSSPGIEDALLSLPLSLLNLGSSVAASTNTKCNMDSCQNLSEMLASSMPSMPQQLDCMLAQMEKKLIPTYITTMAGAPPFKNSTSV